MMLAAAAALQPAAAADIIKRAMLAVDAWISTEQPPLRLLMQVHDELVFEVHARAVDALIAGATRLMEGAAELAVPLKVDVGTGRNWDEAH